MEFILLLMYFASRTTADSYSSVIELTKLVSTESLLKSILDDYIQGMTYYVYELERFKHLLRAQVTNESIDEDDHVMNPLNLIALTNNLNTFRTEAIPLLEGKLKFFNKFIERFVSLEYPTGNDLVAARLAIFRLQKIYKLPQEDLAKGNIFGVKYEEKLSAEDCLHIGNAAAKEWSYREAEDWFKVGMKYATPEEKKSLMLNLTDVLINQEKFGEAWELVEELLRIDPNDVIATHYRLMLEAILRDDHNFINPYNKEMDYFTIFYETCGKTYAATQNLKCSYKATNAFTLLAPFKMEQMYRDPDLFVFHDVLSDVEISKIQGLAYHMFARSLIAQEDEIVLSTLRISKSAYLNIHSDKVLSVITRRVEDMTGLSYEYNEVFQVTNYGLGGLYFPHQDNLLETDPSIKLSGNRIATVIFYLTTVAHGGGTAFPYLDTTITPKKGTASFWYNTHSNGDVDKRTVHGACPVLLGTKWSELVPNGFVSLDKNFDDPVRNLGAPSKKGRFGR